MTNPTETRVVPVEPAPEMIDAAKRAWSQKCADVEANYPTEHPDDGGGPMGCAIRAAITAAPAAPDLSDPTVVHVNMLQGAIARLTPEQVKHLYPELFTPAEPALEGQKDG